MTAHPLGLTPTQWRVLQGAHQARFIVPNGHFLAGTSKAIASAVDELVRRGYLRRVSHKHAGLITFNDPPDRWPVVKVTRATLKRYNDDIKRLSDAARAEEAPP